jgi:glycosyltransferase involved in cell wall biosynthesis
MYKIVYPSDWQTVGSRFEIWVSTDERDRELDVYVAALEDFKCNGVLHARALAQVPIMRHADLMRGQVDRPLSDGQYVICLRDPARGAVLGASGIHVDTDIDRWADYFGHMLELRMQRSSRAQPSLPSEGRAPPVFSIITTVYNTDPLYLDELAGMVRSQTFGDFEWLLLDNGSERKETIDALDKVACLDARIRQFRVEKNIHIIGGNRYLLERARGRFVVPIDSDDLLYLDALEIVARECLSEDAADFYFSDEQKVTPLGTPNELMWRPECSRLFATATCPAAHLMLYRRDLGLAIGAYTEEYAQGSHDWDTFLRLIDSGARPARIEEVLYGWRMHPQSAALSEESKDYLVSSQKQVVLHSLRRRGLDQHFTLDHAWGAISYYHLVRTRKAPQALAVDFVLRSPFGEQFENLRGNLRRLDYPNLRLRVLKCGAGVTGDILHRLRAGAWGIEWVVLDDASALGKAASEVPAGVFAKAVIDCSIRIADSGWLWDALGTLELDTDTGVVTGPIMTEQGMIASIGYFAGLDGFFGTPCPGQPMDTAYGAIGYIRRHLTAAHSGFVLVRGDVMRKCGGLMSVDSDDALYGIEFCLRCREHGIRTAYTPRMSATRRRPFTFPVGSSDIAMRATIAAQYANRIAVDPGYARYLVTDSRKFGKVNFGSADGHSS